MSKNAVDNHFLEQLNHATEEQGRDLLCLCEVSDVIWSRDLGNNKYHTEEDKQ